MKLITNNFLEGESPSLMTPIDSTNDQNIVTIERVNIPSYIFPRVIFLHRCFSHLLNCTNSTKSRKTSDIL